MGKWGVNNGLCRICGDPTTVKGRSTSGNILMRAYCSKHRAIYEKGGGKSYRKHAEKICASCGFEACHPAQMDVHHIDGNHSNNSPDNLVSLCACCHRLEHLGGHPSSSKPFIIPITLQLSLSLDGYANG